MRIAALFLLLGAAACSTPCERACDKANDLECSSCNCDACDEAPASCDEYFDCINDTHSCIEIGLACSAPPGCALFVSGNCN